MKTLFLAAVVPIFVMNAFAQMEDLHGDQAYSYMGVHSGNNISTSFFNDGEVGVRSSHPLSIGGEWPINSGHTYLTKMSVFWGSEVVDTNGETRHIVSEANGTKTGLPSSANSGDAGPDGEWWSFAPLPGFASDENEKIAMSHQAESWPKFWPDKAFDPVDPGWPGSWNGYFGKGVMNADQESFYVMDDYNNREFLFYPDSTVLQRRGLGLRVWVRGFQWAKDPVDDVLFLLYDVENVGTCFHDKMNFGVVLSTTMGAYVASGPDWGDDSGGGDESEDYVYCFDSDDIGGSGWTPVGYLGLALLESAGDPTDGIDNDGDAALGSGGIIESGLFEPRLISAGDFVVVINYSTFERSVVPMPADGIKLKYRDEELIFLPGQIYTENPDNRIDDNLNGLIDENKGITLGEGETQFTNYLYLGARYKDFATGNGIDNPLIDESRDDGIDNDGDWDPTTDDVGLDGVALTGDPGEGDGLPTSGADSGSPGEPNIDKTDVDESDMIGLSAFQLFEPWTLYPLSDDEALWTGTVPGHIIDTQIVGDPEVLFGSGYFSLSPKQLQKISLGYMYGTDKTDLYANKAGAEKMVRTGYRHKIITPIPTLTAIAGNHRVTLQWDDAAEQYEDPIIGKAFEGYKVYRETNSSHLRYGEPIAQFDLVNEYQGPSSILINGQAFWLGENTGLEYSLVDTTVQNGQIYYYAVTSYTHGQPSSGIPPEECSTYFKGTNVATVMPIDPKVKDLYPDPDSVRHVKGISTGTIEYLIVDSEEMPENHTFRVTFQDSFNVKYCHQTTKCFYLTDITQPLTPDTIIANGDVFDLNGEIINYFICGLKLLFDGVRSSKANYDSSGWSREGIYKFSFERSLYPYIDGCVIPNDYRIEFGEAGMDTSTLCYITDTIILRDVPVNFKVFNKTTGREIRFAFWEQDGEDGLFSGYTAMSESDRIIFIEPVADKERFTWLFELESQLFDADNPKSGDFVDLYTLKPFSAGDIFEFTTPVSLDTSHEDENPSNGQIYFSLLQNYPNPFNPETFISFTVPKSCHVKLAVYNIKGQIVRLLVSRQLPAGTSEALWDGCDQTGNRVGSGIYFYRIQAGEYNRTRKMLLVR